MQIASLANKTKKRKLLMLGGAILAVIAITGYILNTTGIANPLLFKYGIIRLPERPALILDRNLNIATPSYSLKFPQSWGADYKDNIASVYSKDTGAEEPSQSQSGVLLRPWLMAEKETAPFKETIDLWREKLQLSYPGMEILSEKDITIDGKEAYYFEINYSEAKSDLSGTKNLFHARSYIIRDGKLLYNVLATALDPLWPLYKNTLIAVAESFHAL